MKRTGALSLIFIVGCIAGAATSNLVVPKVRAGTNPTRWEYYCAGEMLTEAEMKQVGEAGWELTTMMARGVAGTTTISCFKRPLP